MKADPLVAARHSAFIGAQMATGIAALAAFPVYLACRGGLNASEAAAFALLALPVAIAVFLSRTARFEAANVMAALAFSILIGLVAVKTGGLGSFALVWALVVPIEAMMSGSKRVVGWAAALSTATVLGVALLDLAGRVPVAGGLAASPVLQALGALAGVAYAGVLTFVNQGLQAVGGDVVRSGEARYAMLAENMSDLVTLHDAQGHVRYASPAASAIAGLPPGDLAGQGLFDRLHVSDRPIYLAALSAAQSNGTPSNVEFRLRRAGADQRTIWVEMRCRPFESPSPGPRTIAVIRDISDRKAHEIVVEAARIEAEKANIAKSRFLATISHELRTPLNAIIGFSEMLSNDEIMRFDGDRRREYAQLIHESGHHLLEVVNGILDMSKIETGNFQIATELFNIIGLIESCRGMMRLKAEASRIDLSLEIDPQLPEIVADKRACRQIYLNLMSNALKFTPPGGRVTVGARRVGAGIALFVTDTGVGIARDDLPRIGEAFFQARSTYDRPYEGTGLGLSVVKGLAQLHGGRLEIESVVGRGTTVMVLLPVDCESETSRRAIDGPVNVEALPPRSPVCDYPKQQEKLRA